MSTILCHHAVRLLSHSALVTLLIGATIVQAEMEFSVAYDHSLTEDFTANTFRVVRTCGFTAPERHPVKEDLEGSAVQESPSQHLPEALCNTDPTSGSRIFRQSDSSISLIFRGGLLNNRPFLRLRSLGSRQTSYAKPPLEVLFCSWQI